MPVNKSIFELLRERATPANLIYVEGEKAYVNVHTTKGMFVYALTMRKFVERFPFVVRINKQYAVNPVFVDHVRLYNTKNPITMHLVDEVTVLPISRRYFRVLRTNLAPITIKTNE